MPELLIELFSEEIPARFQSRGAEDLCRLLGEALAPLSPQNVVSFFGPRRIAVALEVAAGVAATSMVERGPRTSAPEQALAGFLRKHGAAREALRQEGDFWVLEKASAAQDASGLIARALPDLLRRFPWPKSMRWGGTSTFTWVRPLRRILCLLDGKVVPFNLARGSDDGHGLESSNVTEGHRFHSPGPIVVDSVSDYLSALSKSHVISDASERTLRIERGTFELANQQGLAVLLDPGLQDEVAGLVEWPVPMLGRIDDAFMDLPPEVMQVSMRVNQRYFALYDLQGKPAPWFAFIANIEAEDGGASIVAGNERVLRARFSDARHFWDLDRQLPLRSRLTELDRITFHADLGTQGSRVQRLVKLASVIAPLVGADVAVAERAALLAKADLTTGMVGEFPELQGVMGGYYADHDGEGLEVSRAIHAHYAPKGLHDGVPLRPAAITVALADKLDQLAGFFWAGHKPTGSGDPYALRRAAQGIVRIIRENKLRLPLRTCVADAVKAFTTETAPLTNEILAFITERLRVQLRSEGARHDVLAAVLATGDEDDIVRALARTNAIADLLKTDDGANLLAAYKRAANILRIEERKDGPHAGEVNAGLLADAAEQALYEAVADSAEVEALLRAEAFAAAMQKLGLLRGPLDGFFENVTVNAEDAALRRNRLRLLSMVRDSVNGVADFAQIESL